MVDLVAWTVLRVKDDVLDADPRVSKVAVPSAGGLQELLQLGCCVHQAGTRFGGETPARPRATGSS